MLGVSAAKANFFDRDKVQAAMDRETHRALSRFGAFVRRRAQTSMRKRKGPSSPGTPPNAHANPLLRKLLFFSYDRHAKTVVVGPVALRAGSLVPRVQEYGGAMPKRGGGAARYPARPFMRPAFAAELGRLPAHWRGRFTEGGG